MNFLLELRETAKHQTDVLQRKLLRDAADELQGAIDGVRDNPCTKTMIILNGCWMRAVGVYNRARMPEPPGSSGGALREGAELRRAA